VVGKGRRKRERETCGVIAFEVGITEADQIREFPLLIFYCPLHLLQLQPLCVWGGGGGQVR
jgi:hypothetical protein